MKYLITGASGSFGTALIRRLLKNGDVEKIVALSRNESAQVRARESLEDVSGRNVEWVLGDVTREEALYDVMHRIDTIVHAAAIKRIDGNDPRNLYETNIYGTCNLVRAAVRRNVPKVLVLSTDKACAPATPYGASKLAAEFYSIYANKWGYPHTRISCTRWGNVLGSAGSVLLKWRKMADEGEALPMTDPAATRFWITMSEATGFTVRVLGLMRGGEVFIPVMGSSTLATLAHAVAPEADFQRIPMRAGEKMHEVTVSADEAPRAVYVERGGYYVINPADPQWPYAGPGKVVHYGAMPLEGEVSSFRAGRLSVEALNDRTQVDI